MVPPNGPPQRFRILNEPRSVSVTYTKSVFAKLKAAGEPGIFLLFRPSSAADPAVGLAALREAVDFANREVGSGTVSGGFSCKASSGYGVHLYAAPMTSQQQRSAVESWLSLLTERLGDVGLSGHVSTPRQPRPTFERMLPTRRTHPTAFMGFRLESYGSWGDRFAGWRVSAETTRTLCDRLQTEALVVGPRSWASLAGPQLAIPTTDVADFLSTTSMLVRDQKSVYVEATNEQAFLNYSLAGYGQCVTQTVGAQASWRERLAVQTGRLVSSADLIDVGMIKNAWELASSWDDVDVRDQHSPVCDPLQYRLSRHLWDEYVIDAAGVNLLTSRHVERAHDLREWDVKRVSEDRYLVSATDLEDWFRGITASAEVIASARSDFGDMILTADVMRSRPGPYTKMA